MKKRYKILIEIETEENIGKKAFNRLCGEIKELMSEDLKLMFTCKQDFIAILKNGNKLIMEADNLKDAKERAKGLFGDKLNKVVEDIEDERKTKNTV